MPRKPKRITHKAWFIGEDGRKPGKLYRTGKLFWTGDNTEEVGGANTVGFTIAKTAQGKRKGVEKRFYRHYSKPEQDYRRLKELEAAGANVIPGVRLVITKKSKGKLERSLEMPDLTERGRKFVFPINAVVRNKLLQKLVNGLANSKEVFGSMHHDSLIMRKLKYFHNGDMWLFVVDRKTNTGKVYLADVDAIFDSHFMANARLFGEEERTEGLSHYRAGKISRRKIFTSIKKITRRAEHPELFSLGKIAGMTRRHQGILIDKLKQIIENDPARFGLLRSTYSEIISVVSRVPNSANSLRDSNGPRKLLTKDQRRELRKTLQSSPSFRRRDIFDDETPLYYYEKTFYPNAPERASDFMARRMKFGQTSSASVGVYAKEALGNVKRETKKDPFWYDRRQVVNFLGLIEELNKSNEEKALRLLEKNKSTLAEYLVYTAYKQFQADLAYIGEAKKTNEWSDRRYETFLRMQRIKHL